MKLPYEFGKYVLLKKIANGGMAEIYQGKYNGEQGFAKDVAVKTILPCWTSRKDIERMFIDEAKALVHLRHQNIVQVHDLGHNGRFYFISMEFVDGVDLKEICRKLDEKGEVLPEKFVCFIISEVLKALEFAHRQKGDDGKCLNIVHRDVSPQNILVSFNGEVKLTDFGIAKGMHREEETTTHQLKGKYAYMSPEQAVGGRVDHRSDIFSAGIVLYESLMGKRLFGSSNDFETMENVRQVRIPEGWEDRISPEMRIILLKALSRDAGRRYQSAVEFLKDINSYISTNGLHAHGLELSDYLKHLFAGRRDEVVNKIKPYKTKVFIKKSGFDAKNSYRKCAVRYASIVVILTSFLFTGAVKSENKSVVETAARKSRSDVKETAYLEKTKPQKKVVNSKSMKPAYISVHARPWGYIYIPGLVERKESPLNRLKVKSGRYKIKVHYEPEDSWTSTDLNANPGRSYRCLADFTNGGVMKCR